MQIFWSTPDGCRIPSFSTSGELPKIGDIIYLRLELESAKTSLVVEAAYHQINFYKIKLNSLRTNFPELVNSSVEKILDQLLLILESPGHDFGGFEFTENSKNTIDWSQKELIISRRRGEVILRRKQIGE